MDILTVVISSLSALTVGVITAYVTNRLTVKREKEKQERLLAERFVEFSEDDAQKVEKLAKQFAIAFLVYTPPGSIGREKVFIPSSGRILVGRAKVCDVILKDPSTARQHAIFEVQDSRVFLKDLQSTYGTFVNKKRIMLPVQLKDNDVITLGKRTTFIFHKM